MLRIELLYRCGCAGVETARVNIGESLRTLGISPSWIEYDLESESAPAELKRYGSPTILINGRDVFPIPLNQAGSG